VAWRSSTKVSAIDVEETLPLALDKTTEFAG